jgi:hypothetical protein
MADNPTFPTDALAKGAPNPDNQKDNGGKPDALKRPADDRLSIQGAADGRRAA